MVKVTQLKKRNFQRFKQRQIALKKFHHELVKNFRYRAKLCGIDRVIGEWQIIDVHEIPNKMRANHEVDFWGCNGKSLYLLRIRNAPFTKIHVIDGDLKTKQPNYLIVETPINNPKVEINGEFLRNILQNLDKKVSTK